jgi:CheY-like chemotaxis protein
MPNLDGEGLVKAIRANPALSSMRVIAITADVEAQSTFSGMGFDGLLLKPVTAEKLGKALAGEVLP